jgi:hypothetical protein
MKAEHQALLEAMEQQRISIAKVRTASSATRSLFPLARPAAGWYCFIALRSNLCVGSSQSRWWTLQSRQNNSGKFKDERCAAVQV